MGSWSLDLFSCSPISFVFCLPAPPFKTYCVGSRDWPRIAHAFPTCPHCSLSVPVLFGTALSLSGDIRGPLNWSDLSRQLCGGQVSLLTTGRLLWLLDRCRLLCVLESDSAVCVSVFVEHHEMTIVDYVSAVGQWSSPPAPARGLFLLLAVWEGPFRATGLWKRRSRSGLCVCVAPLREWMMSPIPVVQSAPLMSPGRLRRKAVFIVPPCGYTPLLLTALVSMQD